MGMNTGDLKHPVTSMKVERMKISRDAILEDEFARSMGRMDGGNEIRLHGVDCCGDGATLALKTDGSLGKRIAVSWSLANGACF